MAVEENRHAEGGAAGPATDDAFTHYIDRICAWAAGYGITISEPLPPELRPQRRRQKAVERGEVDMETGEVMVPA